MISSFGAEGTLTYSLQFPTNLSCLSFSLSSRLKFAVGTAVNQALGRCIRHLGDYGALFLVDSRYSSRRSQLARWLRDSFVVHNSFGEMVSDLHEFFEQKVPQKLKDQARDARKNADAVVSASEGAVAKPDAAVPSPDSSSAASASPPDATSASQSASGECTSSEV